MINVGKIINFLEIEKKQYSNYSFCIACNTLFFKHKSF